MNKFTLFYPAILYYNQGECGVTQFACIYAENEEQCIELFREAFYKDDDFGWRYYGQGIQFLTKEDVQELGWENYDKLCVINKP